jgi:hypothetical protein
VTVVDAIVENAVNVAHGKKSSSPCVKTTRRFHRRLRLPCRKALIRRTGRS